ncbi:hypothetical protein RZS28_16205 [Methylocapsa polymorpha]|uniref:Uncharacterized protein n=1 Tax=Methylocapsa polymorpha TaxID=3080828 RepID=A0ABZ0HQZ3_9HYPH|nr:hypothetical protein RZS28_16205 [Methylocapsa sp. RX1]
MSTDGSPQHAASLLRGTAPTAPAPSTRLRVGLLAFGVFLGLCGIWLLTPELLRPKTIGLAHDKTSAAAAAALQPKAQLAARIGAIRGDLWAEAAFADSSLMWADHANAAQLERARSNAETALAYAPINGETWLFLAKLPNGQPTDGGVASLLEMSYFTAPNALSLADLRLERAATSNALADKDIQEFIKSDIRRILAYQPRLKPAIVAAYRNAWPQNQPLLEALAADVDPAFAQSLRSGPSK